MLSSQKSMFWLFDRFWCNFELKKKFSKCRTNYFQTTAVQKIFWNNIQQRTDKNGLENSNFSWWKYLTTSSRIDHFLSGKMIINFWRLNDQCKKKKLIGVTFYKKLNNSIIATCIHGFYGSYLFIFKKSSSDFTEYKKAINPIITFIVWLENIRTRLDTGIF